MKKQAAQISFSESGIPDVILVVDDESNTRLLMKTYLSLAGYEVISAKSGEDALKVVKRQPPSAVILDVCMPLMDGYEVCRKLRSIDSINYIPIVMVTALRGDSEREEGIEAGADDFISKPINRTELLARMKSLLRIKRLHEALATKIQELEKAQEKLQQLAVTDGLTELNNYRAFRKQLMLEISRSKRFRLPVTLLMMDLDHFKIYNDRFGHVKGDHVLKKFSRLLSANVRQVDFLARYGGEEFALILPGTSKHSGQICAEKLRKLVETSAFPEENKLPAGSITMSVGMATYPNDARDDENLIRQADKALYDAKNNGRNRIAVAE